MNSSLTNSTGLEFSRTPAALRASLVVQFLLGFVLNCFVILYLLFTGGADVSVVFTLSHAAAEIFFSVSCLLNAVFVHNSELSYFNFNLLLFIFVASMSARLLFLCCVCLERYLAVVHPMTFVRFKPLRYRAGCSVLVWICALTLGFTPSDSESIVLAVISVVILAVEFFCCGSILRALRDPGPRGVGREQGEMSAAKKKAFHIVCVNLLTCLLQNMPTALSFILRNTQSDEKALRAIEAAVIITIFVGFIQPFFILHQAAKPSFLRCI